MSCAAALPVEFTLAGCSWGGWNPLSSSAVLVMDCYRVSWGCSRAALRPCRLAAMLEPTLLLCATDLEDPAAAGSDDEGSLDLGEADDALADSDADLDDLLEASNQLAGRQRRCALALQAAVCGWWSWHDPQSLATHLVCLQMRCQAPLVQQSLCSPLLLICMQAAEVPSRDQPLLTAVNLLQLSSSLESTSSQQAGERGLCTAGPELAGEVSCMMAVARPQLTSALLQETGRERQREEEGSGGHG